MIGIFRKDVFVLRKQLILIALSVVGFVTLALLICGSFRYGNLAKLPEKDYADAFSSLTMLFGPLAAALAELALCTAFNGTISSDRKNGWYAFTSSLPVKKSSIALAKLLECASSAVLAAVVGVSATVGCYLIAGRTLSFNDILVPLLVVGIVLFVYMLPIFYVFRGKDTASFFVIVVLFVALNAVLAVGILVVMIYLLYDDISWIENIEVSTIMNFVDRIMNDSAVQIGYLIAIGAGVTVLYVISAFISARLVRKGSVRYDDAV